MKAVDIFKEALVIVNCRKKKKQAELDYWKRLVRDLTEGCKDSSQKEYKLLNVGYEITFPRYKKDLYLEDDSFKGKKVLDLGCGPHGGLIGFRDCEKYGLDHLIHEYKKIGYPLDKHGIEYYQGKTEKMPFHDCWFDVVVCVNALDHVDSLNKTIKEISRVLKKGGRFMGQINFRDEATVTEPIVLSHKALIYEFLKNDLLIVKRHFQCRINQEDRYYYECEKA